MEPCSSAMERVFPNPQPQTPIVLTTLSPTSAEIAFFIFETISKVVEGKIKD